MPKVAPPPDGHALLGSWRLVSVRSRAEDTGEAVDVHGPAPRGFAMFGADGHMMVIVTGSGEAPTRGVTAYTGRFAAGQGRLVTKVDAAWHPAWEGSDQHRYLEMQGDELTVLTPPLDHPLRPGRLHRAVVTWVRER